MIFFKKIEFKNFLSTGNNPISITLNEYNATIVSGNNGTGKSIMMDALCFVLYNKSYRKIKKPQLVNSVNKKDCLVTIDFTVGTINYKIKRGIKPAIFEIYKNDVLVDQDAANRDYQKHLENDVLKMNYKTFCQIVLLGTANWTPFMKLTPADRRAVIEDLLDIEIFSTMNGLRKEMYRKNQQEIADIETKNAMLQQAIDINEENVKKANDNNDKAIERLENALDKENDKLIISLNALKIEEATLDNVVKSLSKLEGVLNTYHKTIDVRKKLVEDIEDIGKEISFYEITKSCASCGQNIDEDFANRKIKELELLIDQQDKIVLECSDKIDKLQKYVDASEKLDNARDKCLNNIDDIVDVKKVSENGIKALSDRISELKQPIKYDDITEKTKELKVNKKKLDELSINKENLSIVETLLKDDGIKAKIVKEYVPLINQMVNKYLSDMGMFVKFTLDEQFNETIKAQHKESYSYESFSQGEQMRINLAFLFTWREIARQRNSTSCNFLLLDEVMDSSMDVSGVDEFLDLIFMLTTDNNIYIISHNSHMPDRFDRALMVEKKNNFTRINHV